jgi:hypothetical protein
LSVEKCLSCIFTLLVISRLPCTGSEGATEASRSGDGAGAGGEDSLDQQAGLSQEVSAAESIGTASDVPEALSAEETEVCLAHGHCE